MPSSILCEPYSSFLESVHKKRQVVWPAVTGIERLTKNHFPIDSNVLSYLTCLYFVSCRRILT